MRFAGSFGYLVKDQPKTVLFWVMKPTTQFEIQDQKEVSELVWLSIEEARARMTYKLEVELLEKTASNSRS